VNTGAYIWKKPDLVLLCFSLLHFANTRWRGYCLFFFFFFFFGGSACRILVPQPGIETIGPAMKVWSLNDWTTREILQTPCFFCRLKVCDHPSLSKGFPSVSVIKNPPANAGDGRDSSSVSGSGRSPGVRNGNPLQDSCLENSMDRGHWWVTVHGISDSGTRLSHWACIEQVYWGHFSKSKFLTSCFCVTFW